MLPAPRTYANPTGSNERQLHAVASRAVTDCGAGSQAVTLASGRWGRWEYDHLAVGGVSAGLPTAYTVERRDDTGALLGTIRTFDASFDAVGNPISVTTTREDGAMPSSLRCALSRNAPASGQHSNRGISLESPPRLCSMTASPKRCNSWFSDERVVELSTAAILQEFLDGLPA